MPKPSRAKTAFSKRALEALPLPATGRQYYYDAKTPALAFCVTSTGSKSFYLYKWSAGRPHRVRLGAFPEISVEQARKLASKLSAEIAGGADPQAARRMRREEPTLADLWAFWSTQTQGKKRPRSREEDERQYNAYLTPWASRKLSAIKKSDIAALHARLGAERGQYQANRTLALIKAMFNKAEGLGWKGDNPARGVERFPERSRDRFLLPEELPRFFAALAEEKNPVLQGFFLLALLTGARRSNLQAMRWDEISWELAQWRIPETKGGTPVVVPLVPAAIEVLRKLHETAKSEWVFPGRRGGHLSTPGFAWKRLLRRAGLEGLRIHDLRRSLGSWRALTGASLVTIGKSLGHTRPETTAIYARLTLDPVRAAVEKATSAMLQAGQPPAGPSQASRGASIIDAPAVPPVEVPEEGAP